MTIDTLILATAWLDQPALQERPARTLLVGAATLAVSHRFGSLAFDLQADSSTVTDDPAGALRWLGERLPSEPVRLLLWRAEDIVVPSLIAAAETARDPLAAAGLLRRLDRLFDGDVVDVALPYGGTNAISFDAIAPPARLALRGDEPERPCPRTPHRLPWCDPRASRRPRQGDLAAVAARP